MPVFLPKNRLWFPPLEMASTEGLLAVGGDLSPERLLLAYTRGIFPWYTENSPILWWAPDPRCILPLYAVHVPRRLQRRLRQCREQNIFKVTRNTAFAQVLEQCALQPRPGQAGTWILPKMIAAYQRLHHMGFAHSVEIWRGGRLVGGLYGVLLWRAFFGESMFHLEADASKAALIWLVERLRQMNFTLFDCQQETPHMARLGAICVPRSAFMHMLKEALAPTMSTTEPKAQADRRVDYSSSCTSGSCASRS